jgi:hypothetical protein
MNTIIGILLIAGGIFLGYLGYNKLQESKADVKIGPIEISAQDKESSTGGYVMLGGGILAVVVGAVIMGRKKA